MRARRAEGAAQGSQVPRRGGHVFSSNSDTDRAADLAPLFVILL